MSRDGRLPPGVKYGDLPGGSDESHCGECPAHEDNNKAGDVTCTCDEILRRGAEEHRESLFDYSRDKKMEDEG